MHGATVKIYLKHLVLNSEIGYT